MVTAQSMESHYQDGANQFRLSGFERLVCHAIVTGGSAEAWTATALQYTHRQAQNVQSISQGQRVQWACQRRQSGLSPRGVSQAFRREVLA